jgi:hypothetical protein
MEQLIIIFTSLMDEFTLDSLAKFLSYSTPFISQTRYYYMATHE